MAAGRSFGDVTTLRDYVHVVQRRKWLILPTLVVLPVVAVALSLSQQTLYRASAEVLLSNGNLANSLTGTQQTGVQLQPQWIAQTQVQVARAAVVAQRTLRALHLKTPVSTFLNHSKVTAAPNASVLTFSVRDHDPVLAVRLATQYAREYVGYQQELSTNAAQRARHGVEARIRELERGKKSDSSLYTDLVNIEQQLSAIEALQGSSASLFQPADKAVQTQPRPVRDGLVGFALGLMLALVLAFLREALDTRVRSAEEIGERLGRVPLLARLPTPSRRLRAEQRLAMLVDPHGVQAESFRMLRTNLEFAALGRDVRAVLVTSAVEQEGKSTTSGNLAIAIARAGKRVVLVDLDLRRPTIAGFFDLKGPGLTEVVLGHAALDDALVSVALTDLVPSGHLASGNGGSGRNGNGTNGKSGGNGHNGFVTGRLKVLPAGPIPPDPGEFVGTPAVSEILRRLREQADVVVIDTPPVLRVGDAMALSPSVDGVLVVARMKAVRRRTVAELARQLGTSPTPILGFVVTGAQEEEDYDAYGYGHRRGHYYGRPPADAETETGTWLAQEA
jgi:polysaccharide biosynthesis transport protein